MDIEYKDYYYRPLQLLAIYYQLINYSNTISALLV